MDKINKEMINVYDKGFNSKTLYDYLMEDIYEKEFKIQLKQDEITFRIQDFEKNNFQELKTRFSETDFQKIIKEVDFKNSLVPCRVLLQGINPIPLFAIKFFLKKVKLLSLVFNAGYCELAD